MAQWDVVSQEPTPSFDDRWTPVGQEPLPATPAVADQWQPVAQEPAPTQAPAAPPAQGPGAKHPLIDLAVMLGMDPERARSRLGVASAVLQYPRHFVSSQLEVPKQAFEASEKLQQGEFTTDDAATMMNAAMAGGVKFGKTVGGVRASPTQAEAAELGIGWRHIKTEPAAPAARVADPLAPPPVEPARVRVPTQEVDSKIRGLESAREEALKNADRHKFMLDADVETRGYALTPEERAGYRDAERSARMTADSITRSIDKLRNEGLPPPKPPKEQSVEPPPPPFEPPTPPRMNGEPPPITPDTEAVLSRIGRQPKEGLPSASDIYTDVVDNLHPIKKAVQAAADGQPVETALNPYDQFRLTRGSAGKAEHMLRHGTIDYNTLAVNGPSLESILKPLQAERPQLSAYLLAKRAVELGEREIDTGVPLEAAQRVVAEGEARYGAAARQLDEFQSKTLDYARDSGLLSRDAVDAMRAASKHYIPLYRVMDSPKGNGAGARFNVFNPVRRLTGSDRMVLDPLESVIRNTYVLAEMAERNRAAQTMVKFAEANPQAMIAQKVKQQARPVRIHENEVTRLLDDMDIPRELYGDPQGFEVFRKDQKQGLKPDEFAVYQDGKRQVYKTDPEIAKAIQGLDQEQVGLVMRMMAKPAGWLRAGVVADPGYMARNIIRDQLNAGIQSPHGYKPFVDFMRGLMETAKKGDEYKAWLKSGGAQATMVAQDRNYASKFVKKYGQPPAGMQQAKNVVTKPIELLRELSETIDNATRVGEFMKATKGKKDAASIMKGGMASRDVTQDFQRVGAKTKGMNQIVAFMNGQIQGTAREASNLWKRPAGALTAIAATVTLPSVYLWIANKDDPRYINAPQWEKDTYWFVMPNDPNAEPYRIPKPFTIGQVFGSSVERTLDAFFKSKPDAYKGFAKQLLGGVTPNIVPTAAVPVIEQFANRSTFTDAPLISQREQKLMPERQSTPQTSDTAKLLGKTVAKVPGMEESKLASPIIIDNYIRAWGGTLAKYGTMGTDAALRSLGAVDKTVGPTKKLSDIPILRTFVSKFPTAGAQPIRDFYDEYNKAEKLFAGARQDNKRGGEVELPVRLMGYKKRMDGYHRTIREANEDKTMSAAEKRRVIDTAYIDLLQVAQEGLEYFRDSRKKYGGPQ